MEKVIVIAGPTASGKTDLAVHVAKRLHGEVVSADSMQIYKYMNIGTAKPAPEEMKGIPHYMLDVVHPNERYSVARYKEEAEDCIKKILERGNIPIIAGGTGLYINSLIYNIQFGETICDEDFRKRMSELAATEGPRRIHEMLKKVDPKSAEKIHYNNVKRVIRALEVYEFTGKTIAEHQKQSRMVPPPYRYLVFILNMDRDILYNRIDQRVDRMIENGLVDEVKSLQKMGSSSSSTAMQGLGYKEMVAFLENKITLEEAIDIIKRGTRHYAKRQITWFKSIDNAIWIPGGNENLEKNTKIIQEYLET